MINLDDLTDKIQSILSDEESIRQIKELAGMLASGEFGDVNSSDAPGDNSGNAGEDNGGGFDFGSLLGGLDLGMIMQIMGAMSTTDKNSELLLALKPHLSDERQVRVERAIKMLKIYNTYISLKESGMLNNIGLDKLL